MSEATYLTVAIQMCLSSDRKAQAAVNSQTNGSHMGIFLSSPANPKFPHLLNEDSPQMVTVRYRY